MNLNPANFYLLTSLSFKYSCRMSVWGLSNAGHLGLVLILLYDLEAEKSMQLVYLMLYLEIRQCTCAVLHSSQCSSICNPESLLSHDFMGTLAPGEFSFCLMSCSAKFTSMLCV